MHYLHRRSSMNANSALGVAVTVLVIVLLVVLILKIA